MRLLVFACFIATGCASTATTETAPVDPIPLAHEPEMVGNDKDEHGCIGSAGYAWCARENACVHPWELASEKGFINERQGFDAYCAATP